MSAKRCEGMNAQGQPCRAYALRDAALCLVHDDRPETIELRKRAAQEAGESQRLTLPDPGTKTPEIVRPSKPLKLIRARDVKRAIAQVLTEIRSGVTSLDEGRTLLYGLGVQIHAMDKLESVELLEKLERVCRERGLLNGD